VRADRLLKNTQDAEDVARLRACARVVTRRLSSAQIREKNFSFYGAVHEFEGNILEQALEAARGSVTGAAKLLGLTHQTLTSMLKSRHKRLVEKRTPVKKRKRSIIKKQ
jgi:DNA-binding NtrC family response regulator